MTNPGGFQPLRILHAPRNIAGQPGDTAAALRRMGHHVELWIETPDRFGRPADRVLGYDAYEPALVFRAIRDAIDGFDILHFHFARSLVPTLGSQLPPLWDLPLYRALGLRVYFTFHGSDIRLDRLHREVNPLGHLFQTKPAEDDRIEKSVQIIRTYADRMFVASINNLAYVPDAEYLPRVIDLSLWPEAPVAQRERPVVVHAPTRRATKGTDILLAALDELAAEGVEFDLRLLEGVQHDEVRRAMLEADILLDNVIAGSYGIVSLEAMASSRVAVANLSEALRAAHPDCPVVHVDPTTVRERIRALILDLPERTRLAALGRPFVTRVHDADGIARQLDQVYRGPRSEVPVSSMPDWASAERVRRIEQLDARIARLELDLARSHRRESELRIRLGLDPAIPEHQSSGVRRVVRRVVPRGIRRRLRAGPPGD